MYHQSKPTFTYWIQTLDEKNTADYSPYAVNIFNHEEIIPWGTSIDDNSAIALGGVRPHTASVALNWASMNYTVQTIFPKIFSKLHISFFLYLYSF